jgi:hypothetical protein
MSPQIRTVAAQLAAHRLFSEAEPDPASWQYLMATGIDLNHVTNMAGPIVRRAVSFTSWSGFEFDNLGHSAFVMAVHDEDAETVVDLLAWSAREPEEFGTLLGAPMLGVDQLLNPASFVDKPCMLFSTPLAWLKAGCSGAVILDLAAARTALGRALGPVTTETLEHADCLLRSGIVPGHRILVPSTWARAA